MNSCVGLRIAATALLSKEGTYLMREIAIHGSSERGYCHSTDFHYIRVPTRRVNEGRGICIILKSSIGTELEYFMLE